MMPNRLPFQQEKDFYKALASAVEDTIRDALSIHSFFRFALSGGKTPIPLYEILASKNILWSRCEVFLVDERSVSLDHEASNFRMIEETLVSKLAEKPRRIIFFDTRLSIPDALTKFDQTLRELSEPFFDLVLLGLGTDGHTASIFPGNVIPSDALVAHTKASIGEIPDRLTMTERVLISSREIFFMIKGKEKMKVLDAALRGPPDLFPASRLLLRENTTVFTVP